MGFSVDPWTCLTGDGSRTCKSYLHVKSNYVYIWDVSSSKLSKWTSFVDPSICSTDNGWPWILCQWHFIGMFAAGQPTFCFHLQFFFIFIYNFSSFLFELFALNHLCLNHSDEMSLLCLWKAYNWVGWFIWILMWLTLLFVIFAYTWQHSSLMLVDVEFFF
jgi:hypothetical protein